MRLLSPENDLFRAARAGKRVTAPWIAIPVSLLIFFVPGIVPKMARHDLIYPLLGGKESIEKSAILPGLAYLLEEWIQWLPVLVGVWLFVRFYEGRKFHTLGMGRYRVIRLFLVGAVIGAAFLLTCALIPYALGALEFKERLPHQTGWPWLAGTLLFGLGILIQSPTEEVVFRGWLLPVVGVRVSPLVGVLVPGVLFGLIHALGGERTSLELLNLAIAGIMLGLIALYQRSIWGVMGIHWGNNYTQRILEQVTNAEYLPDAPFYANGDGIATFAVTLFCLGLTLILCARRRPELEVEPDGP
nr:hypothetical protein [uncultured bacterium]